MSIWLSGRDLLFEFYLCQNFNKNQNILIKKRKTISGVKFLIKPQTSLGSFKKQKQQRNGNRMETKFIEILGGQ
jgi:hypothetical protein